MRADGVTRVTPHRHTANELWWSAVLLLDAAEDLDTLLAAAHRIVRTLHCTAENFFISAWDVAAALDPIDSGAEPGANDEDVGEYQEQMARYERHILIRYLRSSEWNVSGAARRLAIDRQRLAYRMRKLEMGREQSLRSARSMKISNRIPVRRPSSAIA